MKNEDFREAQPGSTATDGRNHRDDVAGGQRMIVRSKFLADREAAACERSAKGRALALEPRGKRPKIADFRGKHELLAVFSNALAHGGKVEKGDRSPGGAHGKPNVEVA